MDDEQLIVWGGAWHPTNPKGYPRFCIVTYRGRVYISRDEVPANTSITDKRWVQLTNVYAMMYQDSMNGGEGA